MRREDVDRLYNDLMDRIPYSSVSLLRTTAIITDEALLAEIRWAVALAVNASWNLELRKNQKV